MNVRRAKIEDGYRIVELGYAMHQESDTYRDMDWNEQEMLLEGDLSELLQHEYDHLEGVTLVNRMGTTARIVHRKQLKKLEEEA